MTALFLLALAWPLCVALGAAGQAFRASARRRYFGLSWVSAAWPALALAFAGEGAWEWAPWLLGGEWALDALARPWLAFTALLWSLAALHACGYFKRAQARARDGDGDEAYRLSRFALCWPLAFLGNALLIVSRDVASFYLGFALMTFAAYSLVLHHQSLDAKRGASAYLILAVIGEGLILGGLLWAAGSGEATTLEGVREAITQAPGGVWMALLLWLGFGVKAGVIGLHVWLPLAHPVAPAPASAVLSGAMIKAGLLGWLSFLPLGAEALSPAFTTLGEAMLVAGFAAAFGAALYGVAQAHPKAVLAYSSISQMGMLTVLVAMGLVNAEVWPLLLPGIVLFAGHHALAKGALFLGTSVSEHMPRLPRALLWLLLALPGLSLTGAFGAGLVSKYTFKHALEEMAHARIVFLLTLAAVGTAALVSVCLWRQWQTRSAGGSDAWQVTAWTLAAVAALAAPWWLPLPEGSVYVPSLSSLGSLVWPLPVGVALVALGVALGRALSLSPWRPGDLWWGYRPLGLFGVALCQRLAQACGRVKGGSVDAALALERRAMAWLTHTLEGETWLRRHGSGLMMALAVVLALLLIWEGHG
ncbi:proton-conducting transporter membrane subunit [Halomonas sp. HNIBRBA4712]|uniref:proton-conducting transporter transmembrane domain-containing protein n=1 Tax=Halomonas sp. HNIBRBA4712 TaxID=3373087 RepID=UPI003745104D